MWRSAGRLLLTVLAVTALGGCASPHGAAVRSVASEFAAALASGDGAAACRLMAPSTRAELEKSAGRPCAAAVLQEDLPAPGALEDSRVFGTMAQVGFAADTVFVAQFPGGWRVLAAGCSPVPGAPYECRLEGG